MLRNLRMHEITNEGDGEGPGCLMTLIIAAALTTAFLVAMGGLILAG